MKKRTGVLIAFGILALWASSASAFRTMTPFNGWSPDPGCFSASWNRLTNACGGTKIWAMDAPVDSQNNFHTIELVGRGTGATFVSCWVIGNTKTGADGWSKQFRRTTTSWGTLSTQNVDYEIWVPSNGTMHAICDVPSTAGLSSFLFDI